jgi:hypothetical protein
MANIESSLQYIAENQEKMTSAQVLRYKLSAKATTLETATESELRLLHSALLTFTELLEKQMATVSLKQERACDSDRCTYSCGEECGSLPESSMVREEAILNKLGFVWEKVGENTLEVTLPISPPQDNWVQCDECDAWHKIESLEDVPEKWFCSDIKKTCKAPKESERFWPATRAKRVAKFYGAGHLSHYNALSYLAERKGITIKGLCNMHPYDYVPHYSRRLANLPNELHQTWGK